MQVLVAPHQHMRGIGGAAQRRRQLRQRRAGLEQSRRYAKEIRRLSVCQHDDVNGVNDDDTFL